MSSGNQKSRANLKFDAIVCIRVSTLPPSSFLPSPHLKSANCPSAPVLGNPPTDFRETLPPLKVGFFSEPPKY